MWIQYILIPVILVQSGFINQPSREGEAEGFEPEGRAIPGTSGSQSVDEEMQTKVIDDFEIVNTQSGQNEVEPIERDERKIAETWKKNEEKREEDRDQEEMGEKQSSIPGDIKNKVLADKQEFKEEAISGGQKLNLKPGITKSCNVLVLGAGMAGMAAAKTLKSLGVEDILVVEGSDRIGGRVKDVNFGGINVEVGANWVHFSNMGVETRNPVEDAVRKAGLNVISDDYEDAIYRYKGMNVTDDADEAYERWDPAIEGAIKMGERKLNNNEPDVNFRVALALQDWRPVTPVERAVEFFNFDFEFADEPSDSGLINNFKIFASHGKDDLFVADKRGYSQIIYDMADEVGLQVNENLFFNEYVTEINYDEKEDKKVKVVSKNSKDGTFNTFRADFVICTFSIGVLQSDFVRFNPRLPAWKEETIYMYKMTRYIKIFVKFPSDIEAFWDDNHYIFYVDPTTRGRYQLWQNLEARGKYFPKGTNMLLVTVLGNNWERVKNLRKETIIEELYEVLKSMYGDKAVPPEDILIPDWHHNPLFFGAYSNWPIGISKKTYQNLDAPVGRFYMAGEACSPNFSGYLHGAMESGELTARNLFKCMSSGECENVPPEGYGYNINQCTKPEF